MPPPNGCPRCQNRRVGAFRYCLKCGFDFEADVRGEPAGPAAVARPWRGGLDLGLRARYEPRLVLFALTTAGVAGIVVPLLAHR